MPEVSVCKTQKEYGLNPERTQILKESLASLRLKRVERVFLTERNPPKDQERVGDAGSQRTVPSKVHQCSWPQASPWGVGGGECVRCVSRVIRVVVRRTAQEGMRSEMGKSQSSSTGFTNRRKEGAA